MWAVDVVGVQAKARARTRSLTFNAGTNHDSTFLDRTFDSLATLFHGAHSQELNVNWF